MSDASCGTCGRAGRPRAGGFVPCALEPAYFTFSPTHTCGNWIPVTAETMARREAQAGIDLAVSAADRQVDGWSALALEAVKEYAAQHKGARFTGHELIAALAHVAQPPNSKAWGGPIQRAAHAGALKRVGFTEDPNRHGNPIPLWEAT